MSKAKLEELREIYDSSDLSDSIEQAEVDDRVASVDEVMVSTSIRLPRSLMERVRAHAAEAGVPTTSLIRQWVLDRIEARDEDAVVSVDDLRRFIAERSHPVR
jgi:hypothetical protein